MSEQDDFGPKILEATTSIAVGAVILGAVALMGAVGFEVVTNMPGKEMADAFAKGVEYAIPAVGGGLGLGTPIGIAMLVRERMRGKREERKAARRTSGFPPHVNQ